MTRPRGAVEAEEDDADRARRCIATGAVGPAETRIRFVRAPDGRVVPDLAASLPGRGAWVMPERGPLEKAVARRLFARAFKAAIGRSPHRYVSARRLERAKELLGEREEPLADIALRLRFSCQANFTRAFRQATGLTPAQYRRWIMA
jgi:predicted RNA-binding protein YlxR (DUF448 family)